MKFQVALRKDYFPRELWPKEHTLYIDIVVVPAVTPTDAAKLAWDLFFEDKWKDKLLPHIKSVSLETNDPRPPFTALGRLAPIKVYTR